MSQKSFQKKKNREKEVKKKILARRTAIRAKAKEERDQEKERRELQRVTNKLEGRTVRNQKDDEAVINQLQHNLEILEALQKEQELLEEARKNAPQLSTEGVPGVPEGEGGRLSASADVVFIPNPESNEDTKQPEEKKDGE